MSVRELFTGEESSFRNQFEKHLYISNWNFGYCPWIRNILAYLNKVDNNKHISNISITT